jgi:glycosyltransferase involved in cell wall biosynthesis
VSLVDSVAYLVNRYPEASLTAIRREIAAVEHAGFAVVRFAHRPSAQPLAGERDRLESGRTGYLATGNPIAMLIPLLAALIARPAGVAKAATLLGRLRMRNLRGLSYFLLACRLREGLSAAGVTRLHVHFAQSSAVVAALAEALGGPRWTLTVHGPEDLEDGHRHLLSVLAGAAAGTVAISDWAAAAVEQSTAPERVAVGVVRMGVDEACLAHPVPVPASGPIACVARLDDRKGHRVLFDALGILRSRGAQPFVELVGDGPAREALEAEARQRGLSAQVRFQGWQTEEGVRASLDRSRFLVLPSHSEGLPVAILEAFARARPVIATAVAGIPEVVEDGRNGRLVPAGDAGALADAIGELLALTPAQLQALGDRGRLVVEKRFQSKQNAGLLLRLWKGLGES